MFKCNTFNMSNNSDMMEVDFTQQIQASMITKCDGCMATLGEGYATKKGSMMASLKVGQDKYGYDDFKTHHYCGEACMRAHLNKRAESGKDEDSLESKASAEKKK